MNIVPKPKLYWNPRCKCWVLGSKQTEALPFNVLKVAMSVADQLNEAYWSRHVEITP